MSSTSQRARFDETAQKPANPAPPKKVEVSNNSIVNNPNHLAMKKIEYSKAQQLFADAKGGTNFSGGMGSIKICKYNDIYYVIKEISVPAENSKIVTTLREFFTMASLDHCAISPGDYFAIPPDNTFKTNAKQENCLVFYVLSKKLENFSCKHEIKRHIALTKNEPNVYADKMYGENITKEIAEKHDKCWESYDTKLKILYGSVGGLWYIHKIGLIHRDIKPDNIFLNGQMEPKIGDFGLAISDIVTQVTKTGLPGTEQFMPKPESMHSQWDPRDDIYCLALTFLMILNDIADNPTHILLTKFSSQWSESQYKQFDAIKVGEPIKLLPLSRNGTHYTKDSDSDSCLFKNLHYPVDKNFKNALKNCLSENRNQRLTLLELQKAIIAERNYCIQNKLCDFPEKPLIGLTFEQYCAEVDNNTMTKCKAPSLLSPLTKALIQNREEVLRNVTYTPDVASRLIVFEIDKKDETNDPVNDKRKNIESTKETMRKDMDKFSDNLRTDSNKEWSPELSILDELLDDGLLMNLKNMPKPQ